MVRRVRPGVVAAAVVLTAAVAGPVPQASAHTREKPRAVGGHKVFIAKQTWTPPRGVYEFTVHTWGAGGGGGGGTAGGGGGGGEASAVPPPPR